MLDAWHDLPLCRTVARQLVGDHDARRPALPLQQLAQQALGGALITPALDQHVEYDAVLVDRAPQPVLCTGDLYRNLIQMPVWMPPFAQEGFERFDHVIGCGHVSGLEARPDMAAGRYGDTRTWRKSLVRALT